MVTSNCTNGGHKKPASGDPDRDDIGGKKGVIITMKRGFLMKIMLEDMMGADAPIPPLR
jgi:hypothetical protein